MRVARSWARSLVSFRPAHPVCAFSNSRAPARRKCSGPSCFSDLARNGQKGPEPNPNLDPRRTGKSNRARSQSLVRTLAAILVSCCGLGGWCVAAERAAPTGQSSEPLPGLVPAPRPLPDTGRWQLAYKIPRGRIHGIAWSPDGKKIAYTESSYIRICDAQTFDTEQILVGHANRVNCIDWSRATNRIASASFDGTVRIWSADGVPQNVLKGHTGEVNAVAWTKDGGRLASAGQDGNVRVWSADGLLLRRIEGSVPANCVAWSPDGSRLLSGDDNNQVKIWKLDGNLDRVCEGHLARVTAVAWSPDGKRFASAASSYKPPEENSKEFADVRLWNADGSPAGSVVRDLPFMGLQWNADGRTAVTISGSELLFLGPDAQIQASQRIERFDEKLAATSMACSPNGDEIAFGGVIGITVATKADVTKRRSSKAIPGAERRNLAIRAIDPERTRVVVTGISSEHTSDKFWNLATGAQIDLPRELVTGQLMPISLCDQAFSRNGDRIVFAAGTQLLTWNPENDKPDLVSRADRTIVAAVWSPADDRIAYCDDEGTIRVVKADGTQVFEWRTKRAAQKLGGPYQPPVRIQWTIDGRAILFKEATRVEIRRLDATETTSIDFGISFQDFWISLDFQRAAVARPVGLEKQVVRVWRADGSTLKELTGLPSDIDSHDVSPDVSRFIVGRDSGDLELRRLDAPSAAPLEIVAHTSESCMAAVFSPDSQHFATGGWDSLIKIWRVDGSLERTLEGNTHPIYSLWWSRDGKRLLSTSRDATVCLWSVADGRVETRVIRAASGATLQIFRDGRHAPNDARIVAEELFVLLEKPNGSMQIVEYPEFLNRTGQSVR
jgi:WD40 repeat protein